jgi:hypothetical protein
MPAEVSALFHLKWANEAPVEKAHLGTGVFLQRLDPDWLNEVKGQCPKVEAREQIEWLQPYTHRFFYEAEACETESDRMNLTTHEDMQPILRAIVLSRLVKPTSIGYDSVWVKSFHRADGTTKHYHAQVINNLNVAFLAGGSEDWNTITEADVATMAELWDSLQFFLDDSNEPKYRRVVRAIKFNEYAYAVYFPEISHPTIHAALESIICAGHQHNKAQVVQRLPQLVSFITKQQAEDIYLTCCDFKHAAQAMLQQKSSASGVVAPSDQRRIDAVKLLRQAIRELLVRALRDRSFADILADPKLLSQKFPVYDRNGNLI